MGVSSPESHDLTAFYEMLMASFGVLSQNTGFYPSLDRIVETMLGPLNLGPGGRSYNKPISHLHHDESSTLVLMEVGVEDVRVGVGDGIPGESMILRGDMGCVKGLESRDGVSWIVTSVSA